MFMYMYMQTNVIVWKGAGNYCKCMCVYYNMSHYSTRIQRCICTCTHVHTRTCSTLPGVMRSIELNSTAVAVVHMRKPDT